MKKITTLLGFATLIYSLNSCSNKDLVHPDFDYQTVYFGSQYPIRTVELGEDLNVDNSLDNEHKISIKATLGGTRNSSKDVNIDFVVEESLCNGLYFQASNTKVIPMPSNYYKLASNKITIPAGEILGGVEVQLTDDFFADPKSIQNTYAIPLLMKNVNGADSILSGAPAITNPNRLVESNWTKKPLDYVIYVVKYVNPWHGNYLRRGVDAVTYEGTATPVNLVRRANFVEKDEVNSLKTKSMKEIVFPVILKDKSGTNITCNLLLTFNDDGTCDIASASNGVTANGKGKFIKRGDKNSWGNQDRDALYLDYQIKASQFTAQTKDTLVMRDRAVSPEYFQPLVQ